MTPERAALDAQFTLGIRAPLIARYQELADSEPEAGLFRRLGICLADSGQLDEARAAFKRAMSLDHNDTISKRRLARLDMRPAVPARPARKPVKKRVTKTILSQDAARADFLRNFPQGFQDPRYLEEERNTKWAAHQTWAQTLGKAACSELMAGGGAAEVCARVRHVLAANKVNLPSPFELIALNKLLTAAETQTMMAEHLCDLVYGDDAGGAMDRFIAALQGLEAGGTKPFTWPIVTLFPFLARPADHLFVKPAATRAAAARLGIELNYRPLPSAAGYARMLELSERLMENLQDLGPRDHMDIQGFIWVTHSPAYGARLDDPAPA